MTTEGKITQAFINDLRKAIQSEIAVHAMQSASIGRCPLDSKPYVKAADEAWKLLARHIPAEGY